tara:strand:+ start:615 stop:1292 length:678 start_codon:yes stop_codon:yes gene_type:complete
MGWEYALWLFIMAMASQRKKQAYEAGIDRQDWLLDEQSSDRKKLAQENKEEQDKLLGKLGKGSVEADTAIESRRIKDIMSDVSNVPTSDKLVSTRAPKIVQDAMNTALRNVSAKTHDRGLSKAELQALTGTFDKYNPDFQDANTLAQITAGKIKGGAAVTDIGLSEAAKTYDQPGDVLDKIAQLYGNYLMFSSGGEDPTVVDEVATKGTGQYGPADQYRTYKPKV